MALRHGKSSRIAMREASADKKDGKWQANHKKALARDTAKDNRRAAKGKPPT